MSQRRHYPGQLCKVCNEREAATRGMCRRCYARAWSSPRYAEPCVQQQASALDRLDEALRAWPVTPHPWA